MDHLTPTDVLDELERIELGHRGSEVATVLEQRAHSMLRGSPGRAVFLNAAGDHWSMNDAHDDAERCFTAALDDGGETALHPLAGLVCVAFDRGEKDRAERHLTQLRALAAGPGLTPGTCHYVGEALEEQDRAREAVRWFTMPLRDTDPEDLGSLDPLCLSARHRVRTKLGLPADRYDNAAALQARLVSEAP